MTPLGDAAGDRNQINAPRRLPSEAGTYVAVDVKGVNPAYPAWAAPARATFRRTATGWKLVGLERLETHTALKNTIQAKSH